MKKKQYRSVIISQTQLIKQLTEQNEALKRTCNDLRRDRLRVIGSLCDLSNRLDDECMIPETEVVKMCIEAVKKAYV